MRSDEDFLKEAVDLAIDNAEKGGRPFGALLVRDGAVVARAVNETWRTGDPTAHAELLAIRDGAIALGSVRLEGCTVYASGHPCPMCLGAIYGTGVSRVAYAYSNEDAAPYGLSTAATYAELAKPVGERSLPFECVPVSVVGPTPYDVWKRRQARD